GGYGSSRHSAGQEPAADAGAGRPAGAVPGAGRGRRQSGAVARPRDRFGRGGGAERGSTRTGAAVARQGGGGFPRRPGGNRGARASTLEPRPRTAGGGGVPQGSRPPSP